MTLNDLADPDFPPTPGRRLEFFRTSHVTAESLGVRDEAFHCELPQAIVELASLDAKYTPIDKLWCLRATLQSVQAEVEEHGRKSGLRFYYGEGESTFCQPFHLDFGWIFDISHGLDPRAGLSLQQKPKPLVLSLFSCGCSGAHDGSPDTSDCAGDGALQADVSGFEYVLR